MPQEMNRQPVTNHEAVAVEHVDGQGRLVAARDFELGEDILFLEGEIFEEPSRFSVQVGPGQHVDVPVELRADPPMDRYLWRFLNHSCEPNAMFVGRSLVAARPIRADEEIAFDYYTTEFDMASPFECQCGAASCRGTVRGQRWQEDRAQPGA